MATPKITEQEQMLWDKSEASWGTPGFIALDDELVKKFSVGKERDYYRALSQHLAGQVDEHKQNTEQLAELNELLQKHGIGDVGASVSGKITEYIEKYESILNPVEIVFGIFGWLSGRDEVSAFGSNIWATPAADMAAEFIKANNLTDDRWNDTFNNGVELVHPEWTWVAAYPDTPLHQIVSGDSGVDISDRVQQAIAYLWATLDNVSTADDAAKDNDLGYRYMVREAIAKCNRANIESEGQTIYLGKMAAPQDFRAFVSTDVLPEIVAVGEVGES
ncbi:hypothetical protein GR11A_00147 [Vibrio phage vB_VcorM_GR11A]|nr:hypothetical protein GR11A_00147 [Vibrio phage vB_VcorM_GR11A]